MPENRSSGAFGFLTVVAHEAWGHTGGYLILNASGRPLEFHCTAPVRPNRAQEILYGQTLLPYLYGEQIGPTLVRRGSVEPVALFTDLAPVLALGESLATPLVWVREAGEPDSATGAMLALGLAGLAVLRTPQTAMAGAGQLDSAATSEGAIEASELTGPGDRPPQLLAGSPPPAPSQDLALLPTVVCRLRIDASGRVAEAKVFRSRVELAAFEEAALQAVASYRFQPGQRAGRLVEVWINWPLSFGR